MTTEQTRTQTPGPSTPAGTAAAAPARPAHGIVPLFIGLMLSMLLAALNQTVLSTALPTIVGELNGVSLMVWVITAYILASTIMMPIYGKLGDQIGRKPLLIGAIVVFMAGSVVGALAQDMTALIIARVIQGLGGGGLIILSQAAIADVVPARQRGKYMGIMGGVFALSSVAGPLLGGWFTEGPGWRWAFWINLPLGVVALVAALRFLNLPRPSGRPRLDWGGMALVTVATTALILVTTWGGHSYAWGDPVILGLAALAVVAGVAFVLVERRAAEPILPPHLFHRRNFNLTTAAGLLTGVAMFGVLGYMPTYLQMAFGVDATASGLLMIPMMAMIVGASTLSGHWISRHGRYKAYPIVGSVVVAASMVLLSFLDPAQPVWVASAMLALLGLGLGLSMQVLVLVVQNTFPSAQVGTATAANNYFRQIGATLGSSLVGSIFAARLSALITERMPAAAAGAAGNHESLTPAAVAQLPGPVRELVVHAYSDALTPIFLWVTPLAVLAAVLLLFVREHPLATTIERDIAPEPLATGSLSIVAPVGPGGDEDGPVRPTPQGQSRDASAARPASR